MGPQGQKPLVVNAVVVGPFEEEEEGTSIANDVVNVKARSGSESGHPKLSKVCGHEESVGPNIELIKQSNTHIHSPPVQDKYLGPKWLIRCWPSA